jgi:PleD family two-component response regulator
MESPTARYRVLIVDDAPEVREALRYALEDEVDLNVYSVAQEVVRQAVAREGTI